MIERIQDIVAKAKFVTLTIADQGDQVQITATVRPKDGADPAKPIQVKADWQIADALLVEALHKPPKPGKTEVKKEPKAEAENSGNLFAGVENANNEPNEANGANGPERAQHAETREDKEKNDHE